jgi:cyclopropane-fatty-acyl-phospholipid synthase
MITKFISAMENGKIPDTAIRFGIRQLLKKRLEELEVGTLSEKEEAFQKYVEGLKAGPLAIFTQKANEQHYELPPEFFLNSLGKNLKYSSCYWDKNTKTLDEAEDLSLDITMKRAQITDGMRVLELGCGWGSLSLAMAKRFPKSQIVSVSNSGPQKAFIDSEAKKRGLTNLMVLTRDVSKLETLAVEFPSFDRVVSVEMFEHFKNYQILLSKVSDVLTPEGKLFVHIFTHKNFAYPFETEGDDNWMGKYFFTGGQMPSHHLLYQFQDDLALERSWVWDGEHYEKTCNAWLEKMDQNQELIRKIFNQTYGSEGHQWFNRWRVFYMSCAELFGFDKGQQWAVSHYLFRKK